MTDDPNGSAASQAPIVLVSNRGPVTYDVDGSFARGTGGLVTARTGDEGQAVWRISLAGRG